MWTLHRFVHTARGNRHWLQSVWIATCCKEYTCSENICISSWSYDMDGHAKKCVERYCELWVGKEDDSTTLQSINSMHRWPPLQRRRMKSVGELTQVCSKIVLKCSNLARIGRLDILWSVNKLARSITKWTKACDKRLSRLVSYIHCTCEYKQYCNVGNTAKQCRLGLFQDSDFAGDLEDSKFTSGGTLCIFGSHTFVPISWMWKKETSVSHSSTESEIISLDAGLRLDGLPRIRIIKNGGTRLWTNVKFVQHLTQFKNENNLMEWSMIWTTLILFPQTSILLVRKLCCMCLKTTKQWSRWLWKEEARQWDMFPEPTELLLIGYSIESIWPPKSKSSTLTPKSNSQTCWPREISHEMKGIIFCVCLTVAIFSSTNCSEVMSNRKQKDSGEERVTAKSKPMMNLVSRCSERNPECATFYCIRKPEGNQIWKSNTSELVEWAAPKNRETC